METFPECLRKELHVRQEANPLYSLRAFSRDLHIDFSILSRVLNGKIPYTKKILLKISEHLPLPAEQLDYYLKSIEMKKLVKKRLAVDAVHPALYMPSLASLTLKLEATEASRYLPEIEEFVGKTIATESLEAKPVGLHLVIFRVPG